MPVSFSVLVLLLYRKCQYSRNSSSLEVCVLTVSVCPRLSLDRTLSSVSSVIIKDYGTWLSLHLFPTYPHFHWPCGPPTLCPCQFLLLLHCSRPQPHYRHRPFQVSSSFEGLNILLAVKNLLSFHFFHVIVHTTPVLQPHWNFLSFPPN